jgi:ketosteroid isomerase-like protein
VLWNSGDYERWLDEMGADFEFTPDPSFPDAGTYRGEDLRRWMRDWISTWRENRFELLGGTG